MSELGGYTVHSPLWSVIAGVVYETVQSCKVEQLQVNFLIVGYHLRRMI